MGVGLKRDRAMGRHQTFAYLVTRNVPLVLGDGQVQSDGGSNTFLGRTIPIALGFPLLGSLSGRGRRATTLNLKGNTILHC